MGTYTAPTTRQLRNRKKELHEKVRVELSLLETAVTDNNSDGTTNAANIATNVTNIGTNDTDIATNLANNTANTLYLDGGATDGEHALVMFRAEFDTVGGTANQTQDTAYPIFGATSIPANFVIIDTVIDVITTFTSDGTDAATIAIHVEGANDIVTAVAISDGADPWDAAIRAGTPVSAATAVKTSVARDVTVTLAASNDLTAGKMIIYLIGFLSEAA